MGRIYKYEGEYGVLEIDINEVRIIIDELDRAKIWWDAGENHREHQRIYSMIIEELFGEDIVDLFPPRRDKNEYWCGEPADFGFRAFNDQVEIVIDAEKTFIRDEHKGRQVESFRY